MLLNLHVPTETTQLVIQQFEKETTITPRRLATEDGHFGANVGDTAEPEGLAVQGAYYWRLWYNGDSHGQRMENEMEVLSPFKGIVGI